MGKNSPSQQPTAKSWRGMMNRCYSPADKDYPSVGGVGIQVTAEWHTLEGFLQSMGTKPENHQLRRLDTSADFSPSNCEWVELVHSRQDDVYGIWKGMRRRCGYIGAAGSRRPGRYVQRGIDVHPDWLYSFEAFRDAVGSRPSKGHTLDRINNDEGYRPGNVRWATREEQANNRVDNVFIEVDGVRKSISQWARHYGIAVPTLTARVHKLFAPAPAPRRIEQVSLGTGEVLAVHPTAKAAARATGISPASIYKALCEDNRSGGGYKWRYDGSTTG